MKLVVFSAEECSVCWLCSGVCGCREVQAVSVSDEL